MQSVLQTISAAQPKGTCTVHFISFDKIWVDAMTILFSGCPNVAVTNGSIKSIPVENTVFVSPANSLGYMDGGIDWVLSREMFPGLQTQVQQLIRSNGLINAFGRWYLPVGSAICFRIGNDTATNSSSLIVAPTMFQPRDVSHTRNAYWSFLAALTAFHKNGFTSETLVATSHCCGYGCMDTMESANQMYAAYMDFCNGAGKKLDTNELMYQVQLPFEDIDDGSRGIIPDDCRCSSDEVKEICVSL